MIGAVLTQFDVTTDQVEEWIAFERAIAGNPLWFTGSPTADTVALRWACHARTFPDRAAAERAVKPWNDLGHTFEVTKAKIKRKPSVLYPEVFEIESIEVMR